MIFEHQVHEQIHIVPHPRTIRKAREQVKAMVKDGISARKISRYLHRFVIWWVKTSIIWKYEELLNIFIQSCWEVQPAKIAYELLLKSQTRGLMDCPIAA